MNRKLIILIVGVVAIVAIVAVLVVPLFLGAFGPFDVYARPTPSISEEPLDLLPSQVAGFNLITAQATTPPGGAKGATGTYDGGITIAIGRWSSPGAAASQLDQTMRSFEGGADSFASVNAGEQHWFAATDSRTSVFAWRKGVWIFVAIAPDEALRNQVAQGFPF